MQLVATRCPAVLGPAVTDVTAFDAPVIPELLWIPAVPRPQEPPTEVQLLEFESGQEDRSRKGHERQFCSCQLVSGLTIQA